VAHRRPACAISRTRCRRASRCNRRCSKWRVAGLTACADAICQVMQPITVGAIITMTVAGVVDPALPDGDGAYQHGDDLCRNHHARPGRKQQPGAAPRTGRGDGADRHRQVRPDRPGGARRAARLCARRHQQRAEPGAHLVVTDTLPPHVTYHSTTGVCTEAPPACSPVRWAIWRPVRARLSWWW
jgi:hypothetical protein